MSGSETHRGVRDEKRRVSQGLNPSYALNGQAWNRYSYVGNDPLTFTDPNGYSWLSSFFHAVTTFFKAVLANPIVRAVAQIVLSAVLGPVVGIIAAAAAGAAIITGLTGGNLGQILRAGAIAGATALAFNIVGDATNAVAGYSGPGHVTPEIGTPEYAFNVAGHAGVGCLSAVASGGECGPGALSGAVGAAATPLVNVAFKDPVNNIGDRFGGTLATGAIGGLASVAGGGKFENGAITAAFGYMYNGLKGRLIGGLVGGVAAGALGIESGPGALAVGIAGRLAGGELGSRIEDWLWGKPETLPGHFEDHGSDFGAKNQEDYARQAAEFLARSQSEGLPTKIDSDGTIRVYEPSTNTFGAYNANGKTRSFFKPTSNGYWNRQPGSAPWHP